LKYIKEHGAKNPVILQEEKSILLAVDRALSSSSNSQTIGRNGELPLLDFFNRYLPPTFKALSGHFITENGDISPQLDVMILDVRYPLLAENLDGSVLAMLHSVIQIIEIKTNLRSSDLKKICSDVIKTKDLISQVNDFKKVNDFKSPVVSCLAYRIRNKLDSIINSYQKYSDPENYHFDLSILRLDDKEFNDSDAGCDIHYEPITGIEIQDFKEKYDISENEISGSYFLTVRPCYTALSDLYYQLVQNSYYILGERNYSFTEIGEHIMEYMEWSTASWEDLYSANT